MEIKVYREKVQDKGIYQVHKGEDAKAYVGTRAIMVADGLGGAAAIRHKEFDRDLFNKDKIMDALFEGIYDEYKGGDFTEFENYVLESFKDFCEMGDTQEKQDKYFTDTLSMKKGGYFGSRIVTAIVLYEILHGTYFWEKGNTVWDKVHGVKTVEELKAVQDEIGEKVAETIKTKLKEISGKVNLKYESTMSGLALLGTTLCATLYKENKEQGYVDTLYLCAGDSRPYVIGDEVDGVECGGMAQVVADQEGEDGAMSNCIKANSDFSIACEYRRFKTPCILLNTSDGCFDSAAFPTQLALEKLILDCIVGNTNTLGIGNMQEGWEGEEGRIAEQLRAFFEDNGRHDDSTTIALKTVGFAIDENGSDLDAVKEFAKKRLEKIQADYLKENNPEILNKDYEAEAQVLEEQANYAFKQKKVALWKEASVKEYCKGKVAQNMDPEKEEELRADLAKSQAEFDGYVEECAKAIRPHYLFILKAEDEQLVADKCKEIKKAEEALTDAQKEIEDIHEKAETYEAKLDEMKATLTAALEGAKAKDADNLYFGQAEGKGKGVSEEEDKIFSLQSDMEKFLRGLKKQYKQIRDSLSFYREINEGAAENEEKLAANPKKADMANPDRLPIAVAKRLPEIKEKLESVVYSKKDCEVICSWVDKMIAKKPEIDSLQDTLENNLTVAAEQYWNEHHQEIMQEIFEGKGPEVAQEIKDEIIAIFKSLERRAEVIALTGTQKSLFEEYEKEYNRIMDAELKAYYECTVEEAVNAEAPVEETESEEAPVEETENVEAAEEVKAEEAPVETAEEEPAETLCCEEEPSDLPKGETESETADDDIE